MTNSCGISINNKTTLDLFRYRHELKSASFVEPLADRIGPSSSKTCKLQCSNFLRHFSAEIAYACVMDGVEVIMSLHLDAAVLNVINLNVAIQYSEGSTRTSQNPRVPSNLFSVEQRQIAQGQRHIVEIKETVDGSFYIAAKRLELQEKLKSLARQYTKGLIPYEALMKLPKFFTWNVKNYKWKRQLRSAYRSVVIRIVNLTRYKMILLKSNTIKPVVHEGNWVEFANEVIPPMCYTEFGSKSLGILAGTSGECAYYMAGDSSFITFTWTLSGVGTVGCSAVHSGSRLSIATACEKLNNALVFFHVMDPADPPKLHVLSALDVSASQVARRGPDNVCTILMESDIWQTNFLSELLDYAAEPDDNAKWENENTMKPMDAVLNSGMYQFHIKSPRAFFWSLDNDIGFDGSGKFAVDPTSYLFVRYQIGCEIFGCVYGADEPVKLQSSECGGQNNLKTIKEAKLLNFLAIPPLDFIERTLNRKFQFTDKGLIELKMLWRLKNYDIMNSHSVLVNVAFECLKTLSKGLQPYVFKKFQDKNSRWQSSFPLFWYRRWGKTSFDLDYLLMIMKMHLHEAVEEEVQSPSELLIIEKGCTYWYTQTTEEYTYPFVCSLVSSIKHILKKIDAKDELKAVEDISCILPVGVLDESEAATMPANLSKSTSSFTNEPSSSDC